jgi:hypothetical protein
LGAQFALNFADDVKDAGDLLSVLFGFPQQAFQNLFFFVAHERLNPNYTSVL